MTLQMSVPDHAYSLSFVTGEDDDNEKENLFLMYDRYKDRFTTFPKEKGWITEDLYMYQGFWHQSKIVVSVETVMATQDTFQAQPSDVYLATLPKSGTTWMKALAFAIVNRNLYKNKPQSSTRPLQKYNPHNCVPFAETEVLRTSPTYVHGHSPRLFATHMPYTSLPQSILDSGCRVVYMCRNPKDVLVSLFHFANSLRGESSQLTFKEGFDMFCKGVIPNGPYWDHVKGYYKVSLERPTRILFLTYEDMKMDTRNNVKLLAKFLGYPFTEEEEVKGVVGEIMSLCGFENLSEVNKHGSLSIGIPNHAFFREGKVGDWRNHLTSEMGENLDQITKEKFHGCDLLLSKCL